MKFWEQPIPQPSPEEVAEALARAGIRAVSPAVANRMQRMSRGRKRVGKG